MKILALAVVGLAAALPGPAVAQAPVGDSSFAAGRVLQTDFVGSGRAGPNGENPVGSLTLSGYLNFTATTTCSNASGNALVSGFRIENGRRAGDGFLTSSIDNGPPVDGRPVDVTVYSGYLPRPPVNCPSPGDRPPPGFQPTGGGPFLSGDFTLVNVAERLPEGTPPARIESLRIGARPGAGIVVRARMCGRPGIARLRLTERSSPPNRDGPLWERTFSHDERRHGARCQTHRLRGPLAGRTNGVLRYRLTLRARTTGRRWSPAVTRQVDVPTPAVGPILPAPRAGFEPAAYRLGGGRSIP
jgi:hypothetical protein